MPTRSGLLEGAIKLVLVFFAMAGGFWRDISPPEAPSIHFSTGIAITLLLVISLLIQALTGPSLSSRVQFALKSIAVTLLIISVIFSWIYYRSFHQLTFAYPPNSSEEERYIKGLKFEAPALEYLAKHPYASDAELVMEIGIENINLIWTQDSINEATGILVLQYIALVSAFCSTLLILVEILYKKLTSR